MPCVCVCGGGWGWVRGSFASMSSCFTLHHISASSCWVGQTKLNILCEVSQHILILVNYQPVNTRRGIVQNCTWISASVRFLFVHRCVCWCEGERRAISKILSSFTQQWCWKVISCLIIFQTSEYPTYFWKIITHEIIIEKIINWDDDTFQCFFHNCVKYIESSSDLEISTRIFGLRRS